MTEPGPLAALRCYRGLGVVVGGVGAAVTVAGVVVSGAVGVGAEGGAANI
jgi:hypothetical protein